MRLGSVSNKVYIAIHKVKMKTLKLPLVSLFLVGILSACNLSTVPGVSTQTISQNLTGFVVPKTMQDGATRTSTAVITLTVPASPISTPFPPNTPVWSVYSYTCEYIAGGGTMTMKLAWSDRSTNEEGYKVYRDEQVIATLAPNSTNYVDVVFVATGETLSYFVEAFHTDWQGRSSTIIYGCQ
jgi:hypothetical protein